MKGKIRLIILFTIGLGIDSFCQELDTLVDIRDNKTYLTVKINNQVWMAENLAFNLETNCWIYNNDTNNIDKHGYLYSLKEANNVCPSGWHLPSNSEWELLENYLNQGRDLTKVRGALGNGAGAKLKSSKDWDLCEGYNCGNNSSGFNAMPSGHYNSRFYEFDLLGRWCGWWTSTSYDDGKALIRYITYCDDELLQLIDLKECGYSVRCVKND